MGSEDGAWGGDPNIWLGVDTIGSGYLGSASNFLVLQDAHVLSVSQPSLRSEWATGGAEGRTVLVHSLTCLHMKSEL